jgi:hypothetical protein
MLLVEMVLVIFTRPLFNLFQQTTTTKTTGVTAQPMLLPVEWPKQMLQLRQVSQHLCRLHVPLLGVRIQLEPIMPVIRM